MVNSKRNNPPCLGTCVFPHSGGRSDTQWEQISFHNEEVTQLLSSPCHRGASSGRSAVKNCFLDHILLELQDGTTTRRHYLACFFLKGYQTFLLVSPPMQTPPLSRVFCSTPYSFKQSRIPVLVHSQPLKLRPQNLHKRSFAQFFFYYRHKY